MAVNEQEQWWQTGRRPEGLATPTQGEHIANMLAEQMLVVSQGMAAIFDSAEGIKAEALRRGFDEEAAAQIAQQHVMLAQQALFTGGGQ